MIGTVPDVPLVEQLVEQLETMPASRAAALQVVRVVDDPEASAAQVAKAASGDPALTARLMRLGNSAYYGLSGRVRTPVFAVTVVGFQTVRSLAAVAAAGLAEPGALPPQFWLRAATVASGTSLVAKRLGVDEAEAFCVGLLHDMGSALLRQHDVDRYDTLVRAAAGREDLLLRGERSAYGGTHASLGAQVLTAWHFPQDLCAAIADHHALPVATSTPVRRALQAGLALDALGAGRPAFPAPTTLLKAAAVAEAEVPALVEQARAAGKELGAALGG